MEKRTLKDLDMPGKWLFTCVSIIMIALLFLHIILSEYIPGWVELIGVAAFDLMCLYIIVFIIHKGNAKKFWVLILNLVIAIILISSVGINIYKP